MNEGLQNYKILETIGKGSTSIVKRNIYLNISSPSLPESVALITQRYFQKKEKEEYGSTKD